MLNLLKIKFKFMIKRPLYSQDFFFFPKYVLIAQKHYFLKNAEKASSDNKTIKVTRSKSFCLTIIFNVFITQQQDQFDENYYGLDICVSNN